MNEIQELIAKLQSKGWTLTAIADEFEISRNAVDSWRAGKHLPRQSVVVKRELERLLGRKRIPKRHRMKRTADQVKPVTANQSTSAEYGAPTIVPTLAEG